MLNPSLNFELVTESNSKSKIGSDVKSKIKFEINLFTESNVKFQAVMLKLRFEI